MTEKTTIPNVHLTEDGKIADTYIEHLFSDIFHWRIDDITRQNLPIMASTVLHQPGLMEAPDNIFEDVSSAISYTLKVAYLTLWELDEKSKSMLSSEMRAIKPTVAAKLGHLKVGQPVVGRTVHQVVLLALVQYIREAAHNQINSDVKH
jgi:hypothetical protein